MAWSDGSDVIVIGTDGGLLPQPVRKPHPMLAPGERAEIWKDFSGMNTDDEVWMQSLPFNVETFGMKEVADWEQVKLNTTEIWEFINGDSGRGMGIAGYDAEL